MPRTAIPQPGVEMRVDVNAFFGHYPFRPVPGGSPEALLATMDRVGIHEAWVSNLSAVFWKSAAEGDEALFDWAAREPLFRLVPAVLPGQPGWDGALREAIAREAPCVRADPTQGGLNPAGPEMRMLAAACADARIPMMLSVRLEDARQRHPLDRAAELAPSEVRHLIRSHEHVKLLVTHADRQFIEEVHFGSTPTEAMRILWDICWIWGPPEDHLALLLQTIGPERFTFGTGMPLRIPEAAVAKLDLLDLSPEDRSRIEGENLARFLQSP